MLSVAHKEAKELVKQAKGECLERESAARGVCLVREEECEELLEQEALQVEERLSEQKWQHKEETLELEERLGSVEEHCTAAEQGAKKSQESFKVLERECMRHGQDLKNLQQNYKTALQQVAGAKLEELLKSLGDEYRESTELSMRGRQRSLEADVLSRALYWARVWCERALARFMRAPCELRGVGAVPVKSQKLLQQLQANEGELVAHLAKTCGVDFVFDEKHQAFLAYGFDPVRCELGRMVLKRWLRKRPLKKDTVQGILLNCKKQLLRKIKKDGSDIERELGLEPLHSKVREMMGALRYRYSYTQNQYFHCAEVGFLCGLLSAELGLPLDRGRRAGMLHDIGKAMDHSAPGGHATIGADFIEKWGEAEDVVHAVRAHHLDVEPSTDVAQLVIAADAISGARPGARRQSADSFSQKVAELEKLAKSFKHIDDVHVLNGGREIRLVVNEKKFDDLGSMKLSHDVARSIESNLTYPGVIKVVVVRQRELVRTARGA